MGILNDFYYYIEETRDPRTITWPFTSLYSLFIIYFCYSYFIFICGPRYMKDKPAYSLKIVIRCYNIFQIVANALIVKSFTEIEWFKEAIYYCTSDDSYATDPITMKMVNIIWWSYMLKVFDLLETGFFVLRKKKRQVSFLHVYHHMSTMLLTWLSVRYAPNGLSVAALTLNCSVHVVMYTYYFLSSLGVTVRKIIAPYKPLLTIFQMVQLAVMVSYMMFSLVPSCHYPKFLSLVGISNIIANLYLFKDFYMTTYSNTKTKQ